MLLLKHAIGPTLRLRRSLVPTERHRPDRRCLLLCSRGPPDSSINLRRAYHRSLWQIRSGKAAKDDGEIPRAGILQTRIHLTAAMHLQRCRVLADPFKRRAVWSRGCRVWSQRRTRRRQSGWRAWKYARVSSLGTSSVLEVVADSLADGGSRLNRRPRNI